MHNTKLKVLITAALLLCVSVSSFAQDQNFHIYLAFGQSNMEGVGDIEAQDRGVDARIRIMQNIDCSNLGRSYGEWYVAEPPLFGCWGKLGVADYFARDLLKSMPQNVTIGIVPAAIGGADIALFQPDAPIGKGNIGQEKIPPQFSGGYAWLLDLAQRAQRTGVIKGIIFHQGETNTNDPQWKYKVQEIVASLKRDLDLEHNVPLLVGELLYVDQKGCCGSHNTEIRKIPELIPNSHVVSAEGLEGMDVAHFSSESYRELGRRFARTMADSVDFAPLNKKLEQAAPQAQPQK